MKVRVVKQGNKYLAQYKDNWFFWTTLSHYASVHSDYPTPTEFPSEEAAVLALEKEFENTIVYEGEM